MNPLIPFQQDKTTREAVKAFQISMLEEIAIERVFEGKPVTGICEARELVERMFNRLAELYEPPKKVKKESSR